MAVPVRRTLMSSRVALWGTASLCSVVTRQYQERRSYFWRTFRARPIEPQRAHNSRTHSDAPGLPTSHVVRTRDNVNGSGRMQSLSVFSAARPVTNSQHARTGRSAAPPLRPRSMSSSKSSAPLRCSLRSCCAQCLIGTGRVGLSRGGSDATARAPKSLPTSLLNMRGCGSGTAGPR